MNHQLVPMTPRTNVDRLPASSPASAASSGSAAGSSVPSAPMTPAMAVQRTRLCPVGQFWCKKCDSACASCDLSKGKKDECRKDAASYKALTDRWANDRKLREWFHNMLPHQKVEWYRKQQSLQAGTKRRFDLMEFSEGSRHVVGTGDKELDHFKTWSSFLRDGLQGGSSVQTLEASWTEHITNHKNECLFVRGQWLVPEFQGVVREKSDMRLEENMLARTAVIRDSTQLGELTATSEKLLTSFKDSVDAPKIEMPRQPYVDARVEEMPASSSACPVVGRSILREVFWFRK